MPISLVPLDTNYNPIDQESRKRIKPGFTVSKIPQFFIAKN